MPTPAEIRAARARFARARRVEAWYGRSLRGIAEAIDRLVKGFDFADPLAVSMLEDVLERYAVTLEPWAAAVGRRMIEDVAQRDSKSWFDAGRELGVNLRREIANAPTGDAMRRALAEQVDLIGSLPREAAQHVHELTTEAAYTGRRAADIANEIYGTGEITRNRATLIARTEVSRTATELTKARAEYIQSPGYFWMAVNDADTRPRHRRLHGKFIPWDDPPIASEPGQKEMRYHAGAGPNCRCYPQPVIPPQFLAA
jgi:SPP1 gp7 family putative phage head morphogenesis protein